MKWWWLVLAYVAGVLTPFAYITIEEWLFRRRMRKLGLLR